MTELTDSSQGDLKVRDIIELIRSRKTYLPIIGLTNSLPPGHSYKQTIDWLSKNAPSLDVLIRKDISFKVVLKYAKILLANPEAYKENTQYLIGKNHPETSYYHPFRDNSYIEKHFNKTRRRK